MFLLVFCIILILGVIGTFRFRTNWSKHLNSSKLDSAGILFLMTGLILRANSVGIALKLIVILAFYLIVNPTASQLIAYAAKKIAERKELLK